MSFVMGYRGSPQFSAKFVDNPLAVMPSTHIMLYDYEVAPILARLNWGQWWQMNPQQKSQVAREVLLNRGDDTSHRQAEQLGLNIPAYSQIQIVSTNQVDQQAPSLSSYLLS